MAVDNSTIIGRLYLNGTNDFQQRVPDPTVNDLSQTINAIFEPMNEKIYNEFVDSFIQLVGSQRVHSQAWTNPLNEFKKKTFTYGSTIQESIPKWIKAHAYRYDDDTLLKINKPEFAVFYHTINRKDRYDVTIERPDMMQAVRNEYGLNSLINAAMMQPQNSDNLDEYNQMLELISYCDHNWGFYQHNLSAVPTDDKTGKEFLRALRAYATKLKFPSSLYSPVGSRFGIPTFAQPEELIMLIAADYAASIDVDTLSSVFQLDKADIKYRTIVVPELPVANAVSLLTTDQFFVAEDVMYQNTSFYNPQTVATNYYLHHWEIISPSPAVPAILFTTEPQTTVQVVKQEVTGVTIKPDSNTASPGDDMSIDVVLHGTITPKTPGVEVRPNSVIWELSAERPGTGDPAGPSTPIQLNTRTRIDRFNMLHIQKSDLKTGDIIHITGRASYINPSGKTDTYTSNANINIA